MTTNRTERRGPQTPGKHKVDRSEGDQLRALIPQSVQIHVEELVLHGFPPGDRHRIGDAMRQELMRLTSESCVPLPTTTVEADAIDGGVIRLGQNRHADAVGTHVAQAVYRAMRRN